MRSFVLRIEFPALDNLVTFLKSRDQAQIDALTVQVKSLTEELGKDTTGLQSAVDNSK